MLVHFKGVFKNSIIYSLGSISSKLVGFVLLPLYTHHLSIEDYGILSLLEVSGQLLVTIFGLGLYAALNRWYWDKDYSNKQKVVFFNSFVFLVGTSLVMFLILDPFLNFLSELMFNNDGFTYLLRLMLITTCFEIVARIPLTLLKLQEKPVLFSLVNITRLLANLIFTIYFIVSLDKKIEGIYEAHIIGHVIYFLLLSPYIWHNLEIKFDFNVIKAMLYFSLPLMISNAAGIIMSIADRYILKFMGGLSEVGVYTLGFKIANIIQVFIIQSVMMALTPMIYKMMNEPNSKRFYSKTMTYFGFVIIIFVIGISLFSKEFVVLLAQKESYWPAYQIVPILALSKFFIALRYIAAIGLDITKNTLIRALIVTTISAFNIVLNIFLIPHFQSVGASYASLISQILFFILIFRYSQIYYHVPYEIGKIIKLILIGLIIILIGISLNDYDLVIRIIIKTILLITFPFILYFVKFYENIEIIRLKEFIQKIKRSI